MTSENKEQAHKKDTLPIEEVRDALNEIEKEFATHLDTLKINIIAGGLNSPEDALLEKQTDILNFPDGQKIYNELKSRLLTNDYKSSIVRCIKRKEKTFLRFSSETFYTVIILINASQHETIKSLKVETCALIWKVLSIINDVKQNNHDLFEATDNEIIAKWNNEQKMSRNMFADIFAGSLFEIKGKKGALKEIAKFRAKTCFKNPSDTDNAANPIPIILETVQMILEDLEQHSAKTKPITQALNIVTEAIETMDENTLRQWDTFIQTAQEMAWSDLSITQILGAAIYTSDNVYNRTSGYAMADILNMDPTPSMRFDGYNAFADLDSQQRSHKLDCLETLEFIEIKRKENASANTFFEIALQSCHKLLQGKPSGFCAPAITAIANEVAANPNATKEDIAKFFSEEMNALPWITIRNMHREIITAKKQNKPIDIKTIIDILRQDEETRDAAILIKQLSDIESANIETTNAA